jgi:glycerol-3-phosphate dehydrogenase (NAD(P)+)
MRRGRFTGLDKMIQKDFWHNSKVAVIGAGSWGSVLANLVAPNCREVRMWTRSEEQAKSVNATRVNAEYWPEMKLHERIRAMTEMERAFEGGVQAVIWALPSSICREQARQFAPFFTGSEILLHATKGIEQGSLKRISEILREEIPCPRIGVISGPNLASEIARGEPAATVVASCFKEVIDAGQAILSGDKFRVYPETDVIGVEWAGTLKNILAIASGALDALKLGWNIRATLITRGLAEMVRFGQVMGAETETFLGLAGAGDLLATCSSSASRNYTVGYRLASGEKIEDVLKTLGFTAEGVRTSETVHTFAKTHGIEMPITAGVYELIHGGASAHQVLHHLMTRPLVE